MTPTHTRIRCRASAPAMLVLADPYYPGWRATVNGKETRILPAYWGLRGVAVNEGDSEVTFEYRPAWLAPGLAATGAALLLALAALAIPGKRTCEQPEAEHRGA